MRTITLEEHFATPEFFDGPAHFVKDRAQRIGGRYAQVLDRLCDVGAKRLSEMDAAGIDMQVLSLSAPGVEQMETGKLPLEDLIVRYEEGMNLVKVCQERLASAEQKIEIIARNSAGKPVLKNFEPAADAASDNLPAEKDETEHDEVRLF